METDFNIDGELKAFAEWLEEYKADNDKELEEGRLTEEDADRLTEQTEAIVDVINEMKARSLWQE